MSHAVAMRVFTALIPDDATRDRLAAIAERLRAWDLPATWVDPADYHLTLRFHGDVDDHGADFLPHAIEDVAGGVPRPDLRLIGLGATGTRGMGEGCVPRMIYAAVGDPANWCQGVHNDLGNCLDEVPERGFKPHITLCRPLPMSPAAHAAVPAFRHWPHLLEAHGQADWGPCIGEAIELQAGPAPYRVLARWELPKPASSRYPAKALPPGVRLPGATVLP